MVVDFFHISPKTINWCKGRVQSSVVEKDGKKEYLTELIAEKVTFLSRKRQEEAE